MKHVYLDQRIRCFGRDGINEALGLGDIQCDSLTNVHRVIEFVVAIKSELLLH